jgi:hypothetical protein
MVGGVHVYVKADIIVSVTFWRRMDEEGRAAFKTGKAVVQISAP